MKPHEQPKPVRVSRGDLPVFDNKTERVLRYNCPACRIPVNEIWQRTSATVVPVKPVEEFTCTCAECDNKRLTSLKGAA